MVISKRNLGFDVRLRDRGYLTPVVDNPCHHKRPACAARHDGQAGGDYLTNPAKKAKVVEYEREIDELVYKLYELTPEEIVVVENKRKV